MSVAEKMAKEMAKRNQEETNRIDLQRIFEKYVWKTAYPEYVGSMSALFTIKHLYKVAFRWEFLDFNDKTSKPKIRHDLLPVQQMGATSTPVKKKGKIVILQKSHYENNTGGIQKFSFTCKRETKASASFQFQELYSIGGEVKIEVKVPMDIVSLSAGSNGKFEITKGQTESFEDMLSWDVNSEITVPPGEKIDAKLFVREKTIQADIRIKTRVSFRDNKLPYVIKKKSDDKIIMVGEVLNLEAPFRKHPVFKDKTKIGFEQDGKVLILKSRGVCKSVSWRQQDIKIKSSKISNSEPSNVNGETDSGKKRKEKNNDEWEATKCDDDDDDDDDDDQEEEEEDDDDEEEYEEDEEEDEEDEEEKNN